MRRGKIALYPIEERETVLDLPAVQVERANTPPRPSGTTTQQFMYYPIAAGGLAQSLEGAYNKALLGLGKRPAGVELSPFRALELCALEGERAAYWRSIAHVSMWITDNSLLLDLEEAPK